MSPYPADLGLADGRIVVDNSAPALDGDRYTLAEVVKAPAAPALEAIYPTTFQIDSPDALLHAIGGPWHQGDRIKIAGNVERTTYVSETELTTWINSAVWQAPDAGVPVVVQTGSGDTAPQSLVIAA